MLSQDEPGPSNRTTFVSFVVTRAIALFLNPGYALPKAVVRYVPCYSSIGD
jgi:hypothetical protein